MLRFPTCPILQLLHAMNVDQWIGHLIQYYYLKFSNVTVSELPDIGIIAAMNVDQSSLNYDRVEDVD